MNTAHVVTTPLGLFGRRLQQHIMAIGEDDLWALANKSQIPRITPRVPCILFLCGSGAKKISGIFPKLRRVPLKNNMEHNSDGFEDDFPFVRVR